MRRAKPKLATRYRNLLRDAKVMTELLDTVSSVLFQAASRAEGKDTTRAVEPTNLREWSSECARIAGSCGRLPRRRPR